ncbi:hypothetical protein FH972_024601 [Carpinus fangiana]|uniref:MHD domain-containing protein n=1 Tax=Carpinus fangiana TaxID=176857 RepID=A0A5N6KZD6_9ROSI|nr:hypothetical protein FH972_024601 [Carpinus fangiana]
MAGNGDAVRDPRLAVAEIKKPNNEPENIQPNGAWLPPKRHRERQPRDQTRPINRRIFYCNGQTITPVRSTTGNLGPQYVPLKTYSLYHHDRYILAQDDDVLKGRHALGRTFEDHDPADEEAPEAWKHINFEHRDPPANSSFVGIAGDRTYLKCHSEERWLHRLIPHPYRLDVSQHPKRPTGGLDGEIQVLLGLIRLSEDPDADEFTTRATMANGRSEWPRRCGSCLDLSGTFYRRKPDRLRHRAISHHLCMTDVFIGIPWAIFSAGCKSGSCSWKLGQQQLKEIPVTQNAILSTQCWLNCLVGDAVVRTEKEKGNWKFGTGRRGMDLVGLTMCATACGNADKVAGPFGIMASAIFFLDLKGKTLLARNYRGDIPMSAVDKFPILLSEAEEESSAVPPCFTDEGINYLYIRHNNLYLLALTKRNSNAAEILLFLHKLVEVFTEYFKELEEESIRDNFVVIYELLDEMMDFGYPQTTESKILQEYITQESHKLEVQARPPIAVTNAVSWRSEGIRYRKNEVFLDVVESLNLLVSATGNVLRSEILGAIKMKCYLSGMPELRLGLNDKAMFETTGRATRGKAIEMEDVKFHQCVRLSRFENDRTISFIPPDGEFELMSYRLNTQVKPLIWVECLVESHSGSRVEYMLKAKAQFKRRSTANNVEIIVPVPSDADSPRFRCSVGSVHYAPEQSAIVWKIKQFGGGKEFLMRAELGLPSVKGDDERGGGMMGNFGGSMGGLGAKAGKRPINVKFEIPYFTTSGIQVRYLKIVESKYDYPMLLACRHETWPEWELVTNFSSDR